MPRLQRPDAYLLLAQGGDSLNASLEARNRRPVGNLSDDGGRSDFVAIRAGRSPGGLARSSASLWAKPDPTPPIVKNGRTTSG